MPVAVACLTASKTMPAASPPSGPLTIGTPRRSAQTLSWPMAAARKVSPCSEHHAIILLEEIVGEFGDGCGLARAVDANNEDDLRAGERVDLKRLGDRTKDFGNLIGHDQTNALRIDTAIKFCLGESVADGFRCRRAEIGRNQRILDVIKRARIEHSAAARQAAEIFANAFRCAAHSAEQALGPGSFSHAATAYASAIKVSPVLPVIRTVLMLPGVLGGSAT